MSYIHKGIKPVVLNEDPIDPGSTDWVFFTYDTWLRAGETVIAHSAQIEGGIIVTDSTYLGVMMDDDGVQHTQTYGVEFSVIPESLRVIITHRKSTQTVGAIDLGRTSMDHTVILPVKSL
jgi:hypothetical protein